MVYSVSGNAHHMQMTQAFQIPALAVGNPNDPQLPSARSGSRLSASEA